MNKPVIKNAKNNKSAKAATKNSSVNTDKNRSKERKKPSSDGKTSSHKRELVKKEDIIDPNKPVFVGYIPFRTRYGFPCEVGCSEIPQRFLDHFPGTYHPQVAIRAPNSHAILHWSRALLEHDAIEQFVKQSIKSVNGVGDSVARTAKLFEKAKIDYHSCNPVLSGQDIARNNSMHSKYKKYCCEDRVENCQTNFNFEAMLFCHSAYYFSEQHLLTTLLKSKRMCAVVITHIFNGEKGTLPEGDFDRNEEAKWSRENGKIVMHVSGNSFAYTHANDMTFLEKSGKTIQYNGVHYTFVYTLVKTVAGTHMFTINGTEGKIDIEKPVENNFNVVLSDSTLKHFNLENWSRQAGILYLKPRNAEEVLVHYELYNFLKIQMIGKFPSQSSFTYLSQLAKRECLTKYKPLLQEKWFSQSVYYTIALAFIEASVYQNDSQRLLQAYDPLITKLSYGTWVPRDQFGESLIGKVLESTHSWLEWAGYNTKITHMASAVTEKVKTHTSVAYLLDILLNRMSDVISVGCYLISKTIGIFLPFLDYSLLTAYCGKIVEEAKDSAYVAEWLNADPSRYAIDPEGVQSTYDQAVLDSDKKLTSYKVRYAEIKDPATMQDRIASDTFKWIAPDITVDLNKVAKARLPYVVSEYHGMLNSPNTCDASWFSAYLNRLHNGVEHSNWRQVSLWKHTLVQCINHGIFPTRSFITSHMAENPVLEPIDWLTTQYGRRDEVAQVQSYKEALDRVHKWDGMYVCDLHVKDEPALHKGMDNKGRGIFNPVREWSVQVAPTVFRATKMLAAYACGEHNTTSINSTPPFLYFISGSSAIDMANWRATVDDAIGTDLIAVEIDMSKFEANQTLEQVQSSLTTLCYLTGAPRNIQELLLKQLRLTIRGRRNDRSRPGIIAQRDGGIHSGVPNVTFSNSHNNIVALIGYLTSLGFSIPEMSRHMRGCVLGDDMLLYVSAHLRSKFDIEYLVDFYKHSFNWEVTVKIHERYELENAEFCSCLFQRKENGTYLYTPKVGRVMAKTFHMDRFLRDRPTVLRGMICGMGFTTSGYTLSNMLAILDAKLVEQGVAAPTETKHFDWAAHPYSSSCDIVVNKDPSNDAERYQLKPSELQNFLSMFRKIVRESNFPFSPVVIPRSFVWDTICERDYAVPFVDGGRLDYSVRSHQLTVIAVYLYYLALRKYKAQMRKMRAALRLQPLYGGQEPDLGFLDGI